ncbi:MAG: hypothetical protein TV42_01155 [Wolbachia endosymbiont of Dactylopius coccus]|nr:MAG: hypothetical protein TV42_01155 [Wolbachia endosymbiont of Dactylopius coccus]
MGVISVRDTGFHPKGCHPSAQTLGSRKFDCVLYNIFDQKLDSSVKHWNDITGALEFLFQYLTLAMHLNRYIPPILHKHTSNRQKIVKVGS